MSSAKIIEYSLEKYLDDLTEQPRWVDGSGLSRYNLASPFSIVQVLDKIYQRFPEEALGTYLPSIPLINKDGEDIWLYAKSGTLSNNYNLSGYIKCRSGKTRAFSFMNNHYRISTSALKKKMNQLLLEVYERF